MKGREQLQARVPPPENKHWTRPKVSARSAKRRQVPMSCNTTLLFPGFVDEMSNKLCFNSTIAAWVFFFSETAKFSNDWLSWLLAKLKAQRMQLASGSTCFNVDHVSAHPKFMWCYVTIGCDYGFCYTLLHMAFQLQSLDPTPRKLEDPNWQVLRPGPGFQLHHRLQLWTRQYYWNVKSARLKIWFYNMK